MASKALKNARFFRCSCHHELKFGLKNCDYCFKPTPFYNRITFWLLAVVLVAFISLIAFGDLIATTV